jgi:subtilase family serine protease
LPLLLRAPEAAAPLEISMKHRHIRPLLTSLASAALMAACGGGGGDTAAVETSFELSPTFQLAPALPPEPSDIDADGSGASALQAPGQVGNASAATLGGSGLGAHVLSSGGNGEGGVGIHAATGSTTYYTPAQIRVAYGLDAFPGTAAYQGAGQTIAIVGAFHNADIARELSTFSQKYGLPACATLSVAASATLPLAKAGSNCTITTLYATAAGAIGSKAPGASAGWKTESSLDVEWAHAMAPLARIMLVEAASASDSDIQGAITLAGRLGASVVSMSFGANEFSGQSSRDRLFQAAGVSYVASTGDKGRGVSWPAVSAQVLGVGGTTLAASGGSRGESGWSGSGGGLSAFSAAPAWQAALKVTHPDGSVTAPRSRALPDVAFNADPNSGQLLFIVNLNGSSGWVIAGGTSVSAPQWAGLLAVANAVRAGAGKAALGNLSPAFYRAITGNANLYNQDLYDVLSGKNGTCKGCSASSNYDLVTGLGTPKAGALISQLAAL